MAINKANQAKADDALFPTDEPFAVKALKRVASTFKTVMSFSGVTMDEVNGADEVAEHPSGGTSNLDSTYDDPQFKGLSVEESFARATSLALEESMRTAAKSVRSVMSLGEVEMSEIYGSTSAGTSRGSGSDIEDGYNTPSSSTYAQGSSSASGSLDIV